MLNRMVVKRLDSTAIDLWLQRKMKLPITNEKFFHMDVYSNSFHVEAGNWNHWMSVVLTSSFSGTVRSGKTKWHNTGTNQPGSEERLWSDQHDTVDDWLSTPFIMSNVRVWTSSEMIALLGPWTSPWCTVAKVHRLMPCHYTPVLHQ